MSIASRFPAIKPTLLLDFVNNENLDPRITFTRSTTATRTNRDGFIQLVAVDAPRFEYDPITLDLTGILLEEQRTNLLTYSEQFNNAAWTAVGVSVQSNVELSPDGTLTADKIIPSATSSAFKELQQNATITLGTTYTFSCYVKAVGYSYIQLVGNGAVFGSFNVNYDLSTGTETAFSAGNSTVVNRSISPAGSGWYRVSVSVTALSTASGRMAVNIIPESNSVRGVTWAGDGTSAISQWGAQLEAGEVSSYIPTVASQVTRAADRAVMTGTNFSSWYNQAEGTFFAEWSLRQDKTSTCIYHADDGTPNSIIRLRYAAAGTANDCAVIAGNVVQTTLSVTTQQTSGLTYKNAMAYKVNDFARSADAAVVVTDNTGTVPIITQFGIGRNSTNSEQPNCTIRKIAYYPLRITNDQLQSLTS
jgi:hypothetical protein